MHKKTEILSGYVVDYYHARNWASDELLENASYHSKELSLLGQSIESGFVIVNYQTGIQLTDNYATPLIIQILMSTNSEVGIQIRIERELHDDGMRSILVTEI
jgi:hypothetical protein